MKKSFKLNGIDCPNCAAKLERAIQKVDGVEDAVVSYATAKLTLIAPDEKFDAVLEEVCALAHKMEPDWVVVR